MHAYVIACEYEKIEKEDGCFTVCKSGFRGKIDSEGGWIEHLRRGN